MTDDDKLIDMVLKFRHDPEGYIDFAYPWGEPGPLQNVLGPRTWQRDINKIISKHLTNPKTRHQPCLIAVSSGHGIGKSAEISMLLDWAMSTCNDCKAVITANTEPQLRTKTWPELTKWQNMSITTHWFKNNATSLHSVDPKHIKTWRADAISWSAHNTESFAGLHNEGRRVFVVYDEASKIDDKIYEVTEGALTDENTEIIWVVFGNPTRNTGRFKDCFGSLKHRWHHVQIDSRDVEGTNKEQIQKWADDYGEDSDFFKVRVRGMFPSSSFKQFIGTDDVDAAFGKHLRDDQYDWAPNILTCDPAWEGDDELVIGHRQGLMFRILEVIPKNDNDVLIANKLARWEDEINADAVFVDGGYGTGIVSVGRTLGRSWILVWFGGKSNDKGCLNKRAEMWKSARDWLKEGGAIPKDQALYDDLIGPETVPRMDGKIQLESKTDMKARGLTSPGRGDALALSFAHPVASKAKLYAGGNKHKSEFDPYKD